MANVSVKGISALFDASVSSKLGVQSGNSSDNFDDTLKAMRTEKKDSSKSFAEVGVTKDDSKTARFEAAGRKNIVKPEEEITDEQIAAVSEEVVSQIKEMLMEKYDITEEQLTATMDSLEIGDMELLNVADLTKLVMNLEGVESQADMLTNPDFAENLKDVLAKAEEIKANVKPEDVDVKNIIGSMTEETNTDEVSELTDETVAENAVEETNTSEQLTAENASDEKGSDDLLKQEDNRKTASDAKTEDSNMIQPQDFAKKLTEDLSEKVGETKANDIVRQVVEQTQLHVKQGVTSLEMQLYPEHLGKVLVQVVTRDGSVTAQITAENEAAKNALESQLTLLKENLNNQGVKIENVEVTIASHAFEQNMQGEAHSEQGSEQSRKSRRSTAMFFDEVSDEQTEETDKEIMELKGSTVSYSA